VQINAAVARFLQTRRRLRGVSSKKQAVPPPVAVAVFFSRYLRFPGYVNVEDEASCVLPVIVGREKGLKMGDISDAFDEYAPFLPEGHPGREMLLERFDELAVDADAEALERMQQASLPSEAEAQLKETILAWRAPAERPQGGDLFVQSKQAIDKLRKVHEEVMLERLPIVGTQEGFAAMMAEVEREFVGARTILRGQLRAGRNQHRARVELEVQTMHGWPPRGPGPTLRRAGRLAVAELGADHPLVEDFLSAARRAIKRSEGQAIEDLALVEREILRLRSLIEASPPPPKLMLAGYKMEMEEKGAEALKQLEEWRGRLGEDSSVYLRFLHSFMGKEAFLDYCQAHAVDVAEEIRALGPRLPPQMEDAHLTECRSLSATSLTNWLEALEANGRGAQAAALRHEFSSELRRVERSRDLFKDTSDDRNEEDAEGWHRPPGYEKVDQPLRPEEPARPPPAAKPIMKERELPGFDPSCSLQMRLHGVSLEDVRKHQQELLLLEQCADIIAEECGIPRDWISDLSFVDPTVVTDPNDDESPASEQLSEQLSEQQPSIDA
jgi:hypothetical protein